MVRQIFERLNSVSRIRLVSTTTWTVEFKNYKTNYSTMIRYQIKSLINDEESGFVKSLKYVAEQSETNYNDILYTSGECPTSKIKGLCD